MLSSAPLYIESKQTDWRSIALAALVHILLLAFLWIGVQWQNQESTAVEAEIWDITTREAAPPPIEPVAPVIQEPIAEPEKVQQLEAAKEAELAQQIKAEEEAKREAEIILEQQKKKELAQKKEQERLKAEREEKQKRLALEEQKKKEEKAAQKKAAEELEKKKLAEQKKAAEQKKLSAKEQQAKDKLFEENMRRLTGQASAVGNGSINSTGDAARSTGNNRGDPSYAARIAAKVRANTVSTVTDNSSNNPTVEYRIELFPDGSVRGAIRKLKSSGIPRFDEEVETGIRNAAPFPKDKSGSVPSSIDLVYKMKE